MALLFGGTIMPLTVQAQVTSKITTAAPDVSKDVYISALDGEANLKKNIAVYIGDVIVKQRDLTLNSDRMTVFFQGDTYKDKTITRFDVSGSVKLTTKNETIESTWGIYDVAEKIVTLGGKVILKSKDGETHSERLIYNLKTGVISMEGSVNDGGRITGTFKLPDNK